MLSVLTACASGMLSEWLATHSVGIGDRLSLVGNGAVSIKAVEAGETLLELQAGACCNEHRTGGPGFVVAAFT